MPYACIFVADFSVEAWLRAEPELRSQAVVVLEGKAPLQKVFALNEKARRFGVSPGMTKLQVETCGDALAVRNRSLAQETAAHAALLDCAQSFSPCIEDVAPDTIVLDLTGMETLFGALPKIGCNLAQRASQLGLECSVAIAANPDAAMLAARGFAGVTVIAEGKEAEQLGSLPVEVLFAGKYEDEESQQFLQTFQRWGIRHLRDLARLPEVALSERLGQPGVELQKLARGETSRTIVPFEPELVFEEAAELEHPLVLLEPLAFLLNEMLERLCARLRTRALATQELRLALELENGWHDNETYSDRAGTGVPTCPSRPQARRNFLRTLRLPIPLLDSKIFLKLLQLDLRAHPPGAPISKIHLWAEPAQPRAAQSGLFLPPSPEPERLELTLARIAAIVGENNVGSLQLLDTHRPEAFRMQRFTANPVVIPSRSKTPGGPGSRALRANLGDLVTALRIFRPPVAISVTLESGQPTFIASSKKKEIHGRVLWAAGPWRSSGDWWEHDAWSRDEWDIAVQLEAGIAFYRLVHDLLSGRWLLEGEYD